jgi:hypothetical protein
MQARVWVAAMAVGTVALAGCGSSHKSSNGAATTTAASGPPEHSTTIPPNAPPAVRAMTAGLLKEGDLRGFVPEANPTLGTNARSWVEAEGLPPSERSRAVARLERLGFITGVRTRLLSTAGRGAEGISVVERFKSASGATEEVASEASTAGAHGAAVLPLATIPGAKGFGNASGESIGINVAFPNGPYYYLVGVGYPKGTPNAPSIVALTAAAKRLYARVHR